MTVRLLPTETETNLLTFRLDLMILAAVFSWTFIVITIMAVQHGLGSHIEVVLLRGNQNLIEYAQIVWMSSIFYNSCLGFIKISVLALYARLGDPALRRLAFVMIGVVGCQASANVLTCIFQCNPIAAAWDLSITNKTCVNINAFYLANAALNIVTDLLAYSLPIKLVLRLQMPFKQKIILCVMMFLGLLYVFVSPAPHVEFRSQNPDLGANLPLCKVPASRPLCASPSFLTCLSTRMQLGPSVLPCTGPLSKRTSAYLPPPSQHSRPLPSATLHVSLGNTAPAPTVTTSKVASVLEPGVPLISSTHMVPLPFGR